MGFCLELSKKCFLISVERCLQDNYYGRIEHMRLDAWLRERYPGFSRTFIARAINQGCVSVNGYVCTKPGKIVLVHDVVVANLEKKYVGFAGFKLEHALTAFNLDVAGLVCLDAGLSTGGFSDCLLQHGAKKIYGVDVGSSQVDASLALDERLVVMEQTNLKAVTLLPELIDLCTLDLSFTSVLPFIPVVSVLLKPQGAGIIILIKPQFEVGPEHVNNSGIVHDEKQQQLVCSNVAQALKNAGFSVRGIVPSPRKEESGNHEFLVYATR